MARKTWGIQRLKEMREVRHWSQERLAEASGLSTRTIQRIEQGHKVDVASVKLLAGAFDTDVDELIGTENTASFINPERLHPEIFKVSVVSSIVLFICMLLLAIFSERSGVKPWLELGITTFMSIFVLDLIAQRTFGHEATKRFSEKIFWQGPKLLRTMPQKKLLRIYIGVMFVITLVIVLFIG